MILFQGRGQSEKMVSDVLWVDGLRWQVKEITQVFVTLHVTIGVSPDELLRALKLPSGVCVGGGTSMRSNLEAQGEI